MRRFQIYLDEPLDDRLTREAALKGMSKAALIRLLLAERLGPTDADDPLDPLVGRYDAEPGDVDRVVYGP